MHIASLSLPYGQRHLHAPVTQAQSAAAASSTPTAPTAVPAEACERCESPRRSPLYQALVGALSGMAEAAPAASANAAASTGDSNSSEPAPDLDRAVMDFAHALMQALGGRGRTHEHRPAHHDHGRRAWGEPSHRVAQLGAQISAPVPVAPDAGTEPVAVDVVAVDTASAAAVEVPGATTPAASAAAEPSRQSRLLDAFGTLAEALGLPAASDAAALRSQLGSFLQNLAQHLRANVPAPLRTGALLDVTA